MYHAPHEAEFLSKNPSIYKAAVLNPYLRQPFFFVTYKQKA